MLKVASWNSVYPEWVAGEILEPYLNELRVSRHIESQLRQRTSIGVVALCSQELVGFAICLTADDEEPLLDSLHVRPDWRGCGVGQRLLHAVANALQRHGHSSLVLDVVEQNLAARRFYERHGARPAGLEPASWAASTVNEVIYRCPNLTVLAGGHDEAASQDIPRGVR